LPFVGAAVAVGSFLRFVRGFRRHFVTVERTAGLLLVVTGIAFLTGGMQSLSFWLLEMFPGLARLG
jgi:cytochrome c-type biogenesis protein